MVEVFHHNGINYKSVVINRNSRNKVETKEKSFRISPLLQKKFIDYTLKAVWIQNKYYKQDKKTVLNMVE